MVMAIIGESTGSGLVATEPCRNNCAQVGDRDDGGGWSAEGGRRAGAVNQLVGGRPESIVKVTDWVKVVCWSTAFRMNSSCCRVGG